MNDLLLFTIPLAPLCFGVVNALFGMRLPRPAVQTFAVLGVAIATAMTLLLWPRAAGDGTLVTLYHWASGAGLEVPVALRFDRLAAPMALMVTSVATLIHLYAVGYMKEEPDQARFFALLNLFVFAMLCIVLADNLLLLFLGWEGVGFCSYALIGYWYAEEKNANAGRKAFLVTRVGDVFLGIALLWLFALTGTLSISVINAQAASLPAATLTALGLLLLLGACGKSAQLPLTTWLPDAMAGPTPVSALIHAATMVTAGVYLLCRLFPLVSLSPAALAAVAIIGAVTALYAALCALGQSEIKRVLAYSTMSQVGLMFVAVGAGSVGAAIFHLVSHAFFKAALFMGAGCVIHLAGGENDLRRLGGLARQRTVWLPFLAAALCLAGVPPSGGFVSKEAILAALAGPQTPLYLALLGAALLTVLLTALYTARLLYLVFAGPARGPHADHPLPRLMLWPPALLAVLGLLAGLLPLFWPLAAAEHGGSALLLPATTVLLTLAGWGLAHRFFRTPAAGEEPLAAFLRGGCGADALIERALLRPFAWLSRFCAVGLDRGLIDGTLHLAADAAQGTGERLRRLVSGRLSHYLQGFAWGLLVLVGWLLLATVGRG